MKAENNWQKVGYEEALKKLITIAEQVEMVEGIKDVPDCDCCTRGVNEDCGCTAIQHNKTNSQWRALIVGVFLRREEEIKKLYHPASDAYNSAMVNLQCYRNLFLGEIKQ
jgi:hypothetical protein